LTLVIKPGAIQKNDNSVPPEIVYYINQYGYLAIFILIFLQEIGFPIPIPNELVLMFSGYLIYSGIFKFYIIISIALLADFAGNMVLFFIFKKFGSQILKHKPRWIPVSQSRIESLSRSLSEGGLFSIFICRLAPFLRGYATVISGLFQLKTVTFFVIALLSATVWAGAFIITGCLLGPWWKQIEANPHIVRYVMLSIMVFVLALLLINFLLKRLIIRRKSQ